MSLNFRSSDAFVVPIPQTQLDLMLLRRQNLIAHHARLLREIGELTQQIERAETTRRDDLRVLADQVSGCSDA